MIREAATSVDSQMQLVFFSGGMDTPRRCASSEWMTDPIRFVRTMEQVRCESGYTQIAKALEHAVNETMRDRVSATVLIGDMCEAEGGDNIDRVAQTAHRLGQLRTPVFAFLEGNDRTAEAAFRKIAELSHGAFGRFDAGGAKQLGEMLKAAALYAVGGVDALAGRGELWQRSPARATEEGNPIRTAENHARRIGHPPPRRSNILASLMVFLRPANVPSPVPMAHGQFRRQGRRC